MVPNTARIRSPATPPIAPRSTFGTGSIEGDSEEGKKLGSTFWPRAVGMARSSRAHNPIARLTDPMSPLTDASPTVCRLAAERRLYSPPMLGTSVSPGAFLTTRTLPRA